MALILAAATILGGIAAIWFFWDKVSPWLHGLVRRRRRFLDVSFEYRRKEVRASTSENTSHVIWLWNVSITNREPRPVQLSVEGCWRLPDGRRRCVRAAFDTSDVSLQPYSGCEFKEMRFLLSKWDAAELGKPEEVEAAHAFVMIRDRVSDRAVEFTIAPDDQGRAG